MAPPVAILGPRSAIRKFGLRERLSHFNTMLVCFMIYMAMCGFNFGYDVGTFGGIQGMQSFTRRFGEYQPDTKLYALPGWLSSVMTATPFLGKAAGCVACGIITERKGRKMAIMVLCILCFIGVTLQISATTAAQFTVGRIFTFAMTGMTIVVAPIYQAEAAPRVLRGMFGSTIQCMIVFGQLVATLVTYGTQNMNNDNGWRIPVSIQFIMPGILLIFLPRIPESPRWLLMRKKRSEAFQSLQRFRRHSTVDEVNYELDMVENAIRTENQGSWAEVFDKKKYGIRTLVAVLAMFGQQITGQAFPSQYGVVFYLQEGFGSKSFLFNVLGSVVALVAVIITWFSVDAFGRRKMLLVGGAFMGFWHFVLGSVGSIKPADLTDQTRSLMVAAILLFVFFYNLSWAPLSYVVASEAASQRVREKTALVACVISVLTTFLTSFTVPYLIQKKYANLGGKVGFIYGSFCFAMVVATWFFIPELKGRTLEEIDQLFASGAPLRKFGSVATKRAEEISLQDMEARNRTYDAVESAVVDDETDEKQASAS